MKPKVYLETTVASYLTAWIGRDLIAAGHQATTREWWTRRDEFQIYASQSVVDEAAMGDADAANERLELLRDLPLLPVNAQVTSLAKELAAELALPKKAQADAFHIALATVHRMNYLVTWNCTHIANAAMRLRIEMVCRSAGYEPPVICTPLELLGDEL